MWHGAIAKKMSLSIEKVQKRAFRIILGHTYLNYDHALSITGLPTLAARRESLVLSFGESLLKSELFREFLPPSRNVTRTLRSSYLLETPFCRSVRFKTSPIPTIVDLLNKKR